MSSVAIGVGFGGFAAGIPTPTDLFRYVDRADALGIDSVWLPEHVISDHPELDPAVMMGVIAGRTNTIKMGPSVTILPAYNPVAVANTYASLDYLTGGQGRVIMAVGLGADPRLPRVLGVPDRERPGRLGEALELMRLLWTEETVDYAGEYYHVEGVSVNPKPAGGSLDVWIGGNGDAALRRVAKYGDGWLPSLITPATFTDRINRLMRYCSEEGRVVERDEAGVIIRCHLTPDLEEAHRVRDDFLARRGRPVPKDVFEACSAFGTPEECVTTLETYVEAGCTKFILMPAGPPNERTDQLDVFADQVIPAFD